MCERDRPCVGGCVRRRRPCPSSRSPSRPCCRQRGERRSSTRVESLRHRRWCGEREPSEDICQGASAIDGLRILVNRIRIKVMAGTAGWGSAGEPLGKIRSSAIRRVAVRGSFWDWSPIAESTAPRPRARSRTTGSARHAVAVAGSCSSAKSAGRTRSRALHSSLCVRGRGGFRTTWSFNRARIAHGITGNTYQPRLTLR